MRTIEAWVEAPLKAFVAESQARVALLMTSSGQVVAQHGFTRSLDVMTAAALGAGIIASTRELAKETRAGSFGAVVELAELVRWPDALGWLRSDPARGVSSSPAELIGG